MNNYVKFALLLKIECKVDLFFFFAFSGWKVLI